MNRTLRRATAGAWELLARCGAAIVAPIERAFAVTLGRLLQASDALRRVEDGLVGPLRFAAWPFRAAWRSLERSRPDAAERGVAWLLQPLWRPAAALFGFAHAWLATRSYRRMAWGLPAIALLVPIVAAAVWGGMWGREHVAAQYRAAARDAREAEDYARMQLLERRLAQLGVDSRPNDFRAALALERAGKLDDAVAQMQRLAPEDAIGLPAAHEWLAVKLVNGELDVPPEDRLRLAGAHIDCLEQLGGKGPTFGLLRGVWLAQSGRLEEAADALTPHVGSSRMAALERMKANLALNRLEEARRDARALRLHLEEAERAAERRGEALPPASYQAWAQAEELLGDDARRARVLRQWLAGDPTIAAARRAVAELAAEELNAMLASPHPHGGALAEQLTELARLVENPAALEPLVRQWYGQRRQAPALAAMFDQIAAADDAPLPLALAIGTAAAMDGEFDVARRLLGRVVAGRPEDAAAWNNLAWALSQGADTDLDRALEAANRAVALAPEEFRFRETRGQVLMALGQWREAVDDLEFALNGMPSVPAIHGSLAKAYDALGEADLAELHRQQVP